jgi:uncharacterized protein YdeI (YjbR/CyaY-like superfamily)
MKNNNPLIDQYIEKSADFSKPILQHLRKLIHTICPTVEEAIKWGHPHFIYKGDMMCSMAAFKKHAAFGFWKANLIDDPILQEMAKAEVAMGHTGKITSLKDLPADKKLKGWIKKAMELNDKGIKIIKTAPKKATQPITIPDYFTQALAKNKVAKKKFDDFSYSHKKEYLDWITEAKTETTRNKRIATTIEWLTEGKDRNWQYR